MGKEPAVHGNLTVWKMYLVHHVERNLEVRHSERRLFMGSRSVICSKISTGIVPSGDPTVRMIWFSIAETLGHDLTAEYMGERVRPFRWPDAQRLQVAHIPQA